jgi:hypothetical protein
MTTAAQSFCFRFPLEIWGEVCGQLADDRPTLAAAIRSSRVLFFPAAQVLWRSPPSSALASVASEERRDVYGGAVRTLSALEGPEPVDLSLWRFPGVRKIRYDFDCWPQRPRSLEQLLRCCGHKLTRAFIWGYFIQGVTEVPAPADSSNRCSKCAGKKYYCVNGETLECFARRMGLRELELRAHVNSKALQYCLQQLAGTERPFSQLRTFWGIVMAEDLPDLIQLLTHSPLVVLTLELLPSVSSTKLCLVPLAHLLHLRSLHISWITGHQFTAEEFLQLGCASRDLRLLSLSTLPRPDTRAITDENLQRVLSNFPALEVLALYSETQLTANAIRIVGETCRELGVLSLQVLCDIDCLELSTASVLFPKLTNLLVDFPDHGPSR